MGLKNGIDLLNVPLIIRECICIRVIHKLLMVGTGCHGELTRLMVDGPFKLKQINSFQSFAFLPSSPAVVE